MGASDYIAISKAVRTIFLEDVPILDLSALNQVHITFLLSVLWVGGSVGRSILISEIRVALERNIKYNCCDYKCCCYTLGRL